MHTYDVVTYRLEEPLDQWLIANRTTIREARLILRSYCGDGWVLDRRPDMNTFGDVVAAIQVKPFKEKQNATRHIPEEEASQAS
jgi:hypothetical protein